MEGIRHLGDCMPEVWCVQINLVPRRCFMPLELHADSILIIKRSASRVLNAPGMFILLQDGTHRLFNVPRNTCLGDGMPVVWCVQITQVPSWYFIPFEFHANSILITKRSASRVLNAPGIFVLGQDKTHRLFCVLRNTHLCDCMPDVWSIQITHFTRW